MSSNLCCPPLDVDSILNQIDAKKYHYIEEDGTGPKTIGFIADNLDAIKGTDPLVGCLCNYDSSSNLRGLDYARLTAILWAKVKDLEARLSTLEGA